LAPWSPLETRGDRDGWRVTNQMFQNNLTCVVAEKADTRWRLLETDG
jgi:hypothetical protein